MSRQFEFLHEKTSPGEHTLTMTNFDGPQAAVDYSHYTDPDEGSRIEIGYLKSHNERKGHGRRLMQEMYDRYPKSFIDWGLTVHPAATRMAQDFEDKYYNRTTYQADDYDEWDVND